MKKSYLFSSERLGFRNWIASDVPQMIEISSDEKVMQFFPGIATPDQTRAFIERMKEMLARTGFCYFAVDRLDTNEFIGFIGMSEQDYAVDFCPCIDIGWRLSPKHWGFGFATEGAEKCLDYAHQHLGIKNILSVAPQINTQSISIMQKIGMKELVKFEHPKLTNDARLVNCICYSSEK